MYNQKTQDFLKVLDMLEPKQCKYFYDKIDYRCVDVENIVVVKGKGLDLESAGEVKFNRKEMADFAFRLRDEVYKNEKTCPMLRKCMQTVTARAFPLFSDEDLWETWWVAQAQPIHWIIAALIAKQLAKEKNVH